jgi:hypothetical protein
MSAQELTVKERAESLLNAEDRKILRDFEESGKPGLGPSLCTTFFELFLNGKTEREIQKLNPVYDLGSIIQARVKYNWDEKKDKYISELQSGVVARMLQVQMEATNFMADVLSATHKRYGTAIKRYLQSSDPKDLEGFDINNIQAYSKSIEALLKITGQDQKKKIELGGTVNSNVQISDMSEKALTPEQAAALLEILAADEDSE